MSLKEKIQIKKIKKVFQKSFIAVSKKPVFMMIFTLVLCLISAIGASLIKAGGGTITVKELKWETPSGHRQNAQLFIPETATPITQAPAIVVVHGWGNNLEAQTPNYVELSRRGYVVLAIDMYGHGDSDNVAIDTWWDENNAANGVYDAVKLLAALPYVDISQIGVEGHSNGAYSCNRAVLEDNKAKVQLIACVLLECNDAFYTNEVLYARYFDDTDTNFANVYGSRDAAIIAARYDECFHRMRLSDGIVTAPRDFIHQVTAQSFLHFGVNPTGLEARTGNTYYSKSIDGTDAVRIIYTPNVIHGWAYLSARVTGDFINFFQKVMPAPNPIPADRQIWQWKVFFEAIGVIGFFMFFVYFIMAMLETRFFETLKAKEKVLPSEIDRTGMKLMWRGLIAGVLFSAFSFLIVYVVGQVALPEFFNQWHSNVYALWSLLTGLFTLFIMNRNYRKYSKANGLNLREHGVFLTREKAWKTILLGFLTAVCAYATVFGAHYFFITDFRLWDFFRLRPFDAEIFGSILKFAPFFIFFYTLNSIAMNVFNYVRIGKNEWVNTLVMAIFNVLGVILIIIVYYGWFLITGLLPTDNLSWGVGTLVMWTYPMVTALPLAAVINRIIYKETRNPYISSIAFSLIITVMTCSNTLTYLI